MKTLLLKHGQKVLTQEQKEFIINTGKLPELNGEQKLSLALTEMGLLLNTSLPNC